MKARLERRLTAQRFRQELSLPEVLLWNRLKGRQLRGFHFRKQHPIGPYILDFYCEALRLAVEVDGAAHLYDDRPARDHIRDVWLARRGIQTLRIEAREVLASADDSAERILAFARATPSGPPGHLPQRGRRRARGSDPGPAKPPQSD